jgi:translation initiation factor IF-2
MDSNPYTQAIEFLLKNLVRHGDGVSTPAAQRQLEAIAAFEAEEAMEHLSPQHAPAPASPAPVHSPATPAGAPATPAAPAAAAVQHPAPTVAPAIAAPAATPAPTK